MAPQQGVRPRRRQNVAPTAPTAIRKAGKVRSGIVKGKKRSTQGIDFVIPIVFPDYRITTDLGERVDDAAAGFLGHAGVLFAKGTSSLTKYYEYGR